MFTVSSNVFRTQEWPNLARDDVSRLRLTLTLLGFLVGWWLVGLVHQFSHEDGDSALLRNVGFYQPIHTAIQPKSSSER
jgi:hypothetical protein